jgi:hypothetical protein
MRQSFRAPRTALLPQMSGRGCERRNVRVRAFKPPFIPIEETVMKSFHSTILFSAIALSAASIASASEDAQSPLGQVTVRHSSPAAVSSKHSAQISDCTPPNSADVCAAFHVEVRRNFNSREIGMLFGSATAYPESRGSYSKVAERYENFVRNYDEKHLTAFASTK